MTTRDVLKSSINRLLSGTVVVTVGFLINGSFAYLLQLFLGRHLSIEDFGTFNTLLSLFYLFSVPAAVLAVSVVKISSELLGENKHGELTKFFWSLSRNVVLWGSIFAALLYYFRNPLASYLNIKDPLLFLFLGFYISSTLLVVPVQSYLRGLLMFNKFALFTTIMGILRFSIPATIVYFGYKVGGVYVGISLSLFLSFFIALFLLKDNFVKEKDVEVNHLYKKLMNFSVPVLLVHLGLMALINTDVILVKKYFTEAQAGYYAGVVTLGKIILFGVGSVAMVMFPEISALKAANKNYMKKLKFFILLQVGLLVPAVLLFTIFPKFITLLFFGEQFSNSIIYLPLFSIFISLYVLVSFLINFFLSIDKTNIFIFLPVPIVLQIVLISLNHSSLHQVITANIVSALVLLVSLSFYLYKVSKDITHV
ncbi:oligosaccharide flippase family protein [Patescibacteria group bacterium]